MVTGCSGSKSELWSQGSRFGSCLCPSQAGSSGPVTFLLCAPGIPPAKWESNRSQRELEGLYEFILGKA